MDPASAKRIVVLSLGLTGATSVVASFAQGDVPRARIFVGLAVAGVILVGAAEVAPGLAASMAGLVVVAGVLTNGATVATAVNRLVR